MKKVPIFLNRDTFLSLCDNFTECLALCEDLCLVDTEEYEVFDWLRYVESNLATDDDCRQSLLKIQYDLESSLSTPSLFDYVPS